MTEYGVVFKSFLGKIRDDLYISTDVEMVENDLTILLNAAIPYFNYPKIDLRDKDDDLQIFEANLTVDEVEILAMAMVVEWTEREIHNVDMLRQSMTTKDFNTYSQSSHINALGRTADRMQKKLKNRLIKYSLRRDDGTNGLSDLGGD